jgi:hypothetical protein
MPHYRGALSSRCQSRWLKMGMILDVFIAADAGVATYAFGVDGMHSGNAAFAGLMVFIAVLILLDRWRRGWF